MKTLIFYEVKKLLRRKSTAVVYLLMAACIFAVNLVVISDQGWFQADGAELSGLAAIRAERAATHAQAGPLTQERVSAALRHYHSVYGDMSNYDGATGSLRNEVYCKEIAPYKRIFNLLARVYAPTGAYDLRALDNVTGEVDFYAARRAKVRAILDMDITTGNFTRAEKDLALRLDQQVSSPFYFDYTSGWRTLLARTFSLSFLLIALALCVIISPVFAFEYQTGADALVLSAKRGGVEIVRAKIAAGFLAVCVTYALGVGVTLLCALVPFGAEGWNCEFQILSETSFYNLKIWRVVFWGILINFIVMASVMAFVMFLSAVCKTPFTAVIISMLCIAVPMFFPTSSSSGLFNHFLALLPAQAMDSFTVFSAYLFFPVGNFVVTLPYMILFAALGSIVVFLPFANRFFRSHQVA